MYKLSEPIGRCNQCVTPALSRVHHRGFGPVTIIVDLEFGLNRLHIDASHQFADQLHLSPAAFVGADLSCQRNGIDQFLGKSHRGQSRRRQHHQAFAELLQCMHIALALRLAGTRIVILGIRLRGVDWREEALGQVRNARGWLLQQIAMIDR